MPTYPSYRSFGSRPQPGGAQNYMVNLRQAPSSSSPRPIQTMPAGGGMGSFGQQMSRGSWSQPRPGNRLGGGRAQGVGGWSQTGQNQWTRNDGGIRSDFSGARPPGAPPTGGLNVPGLVGAEFNQQQALYDQNRSAMLGLAGDLSGRMDQQAMGFQQMAGMEAARGRQSSDQFMQMAGSPGRLDQMSQQFTKAPERFGDEGVRRQSEAAQSFQRFADQQGDRTAENASSAMVGMQAQQQSQLQQMRDRFGQMGVGPESMAMMQQELGAMGSMGRQQVLAQIGEQDRQFQSQVRQAASALGMQAGAASTANDAANAGLRQNYAQMGLGAAQAAEANRQAWAQLSQASGQQAFNNWMQAQVQAAELQQSGYGALAQAMQQYPSSAVSFLGSLLTAANVMSNTPLGDPRFAEAMGVRAS